MSVPDKEAFRFQINRQRVRWRTLRDQVAERLSADEICEIDAQLDRATAGVDFEDARHAQRALQYITDALDDIERLIKPPTLARRPRMAHPRSRNLPSFTEAMTRVRENVETTEGQGLMASPLFSGPEASASASSLTAWHAEVAGKSAVIKKIEPQGRDRVSADLDVRAWPGRIRATWFTDGASCFSPGVEVQLRIEGRRQFMVTADGAVIELSSLEVTKPSGPRTDPNLSNLRVTVPRSLPQELDDESPEEAQARLKQAQSVASVYTSSFDARDPDDVIKEDEARGEAAARVTKVNAHTVDFVPQWAGAEPPSAVKPLTTLAQIEHPRREDFAAALNILYAAAGLNVHGVALTEDAICMKFEVQGVVRQVEVPWPPILRELLDVTSSRRTNDTTQDPES